MNKYDLDIILRDDVHTTEHGSSLYSKIIYEKFKENKDNMVIPSGMPETQYTNIKKISVDREFKSFLRIRGNCEIIGFLLTIGPHSGLIEVVEDRSETYTINTWDRWCHYTRRHFNLPMRISGEYHFNILQTDFDTSSCKIQMDFKKEEKKLIVHDIYYVGNELRIDNIHDSHKIKRLPPIATNILGHINQIRKILNKL